ncbi:ABC transporter ATP-binding protein [Pseudoroseomonas cervicalis]|uniref:ABC transporter ATP-binding protein n=1 Tax=Teichococcus cervicalis TaxID=204525 RepID=UPI00278A60FE|nr:ABC transporter ATP-binding protein [Pseudoroseomonas cervicalis]MDQ1079740.1 branched-chain amino acid transport system ATP-binding protein [Pseudoroseomonas cervicalis]
MALLSTQGVTLSFGGLRALDDVSVSVEQGDLLGIIGTNGAGKSTLFSAITGHIRPDAGSIRLQGEEIGALPVHHRVRRGLARTFQVPREFGHMTVFDNMMTAAPAQAGERLANLLLRPAQVKREEAEIAERARELLAFLNLTRVAGEMAGRLSGGQKKLLELGRLLMLQPSCLLLDEPFAGVNPVLVGEIAGKVAELNARGMTVVIIEHNLDELARLARRFYVMDRGRVIAEGTPDAVLEDARVREAYMGGVA